MSKLTDKQRKELDDLKKKSDREIDTSDIAEITRWDEAVVGRFYRPVKKQITLRLDADVIEWFKQKGDKYQTRINEALRDYIKTHRKAG